MLKENFMMMRAYGMPEFLIPCSACDGSGVTNHNFRNKDGSTSLIKEQTCMVCKGKCVMVENREW